MDSFIASTDTSKLAVFLILSFCSIFAGMSKMGFPGINILITPIIFFYTKNVQVMVTLTLLMLYPSDLLGTYVFRKDINKKAYWMFVPWTIAGILVAAIAGKFLPKNIFLSILIVIIFSFAIIMLIREIQASRSPKKTETPIPKKESSSKVALFDKVLGFLSGVSSMLANTAGPLTSMYLLSMNLSKRQFIGTGALLYLSYNTIKLFITIYVWKTLTLDMFLYGLALLPCSIAGAFFSKWLSNKISEKFFRWLIIGIIILTGLMLLRI